MHTRAAMLQAKKIQINTHTRGNSNSFVFVKGKVNIYINKNEEFFALYALECVIIVCVRLVFEICISNCFGL